MIAASLLVSVVIAARAIGAGVVFHLIAYGLRKTALVVFIAVCLTDLVDGQLGKRRGTRSIWGPYGDAIADFLVALLGFTAVVLDGVYPAWLLGVIIVMFAQFVVTSGVERPVYDPVGKYYGVLLFAALGVSLLHPHPAVTQAVLVGIVAVTVVTLTSRAGFLVRHRRRMASLASGE